MTRSADVRLLRPIRIVLATDDDRFAVRMRMAARERRMVVEPVASDADPELAIVAHRADVFVVDAGAGLPRGARTASSVAVLHPDLPVVVVAEKPAAETVAGLPLLDKWRSAERLVSAIELAYLGLRP